MAEIEGGYILVSRKLIDSEIWEKPPIYLKVWLYILTKAQHKPYKNLDRGELLISIPEIIEACSYKVGYRTERPSKTQIYNILEWLRNSDEGSNEGQVNDTMIATTKTTRGMVVKVHNYNVYQDPKKYERNDERNDEKTTSGTMPERQADTINKNDKNVKNEKKKETVTKKNYSELVRMTEEEYSRLVEEFGASVIQSKIEDLDNYIGSTGKKYKDHNRTIRSWLKRDNIVGGQVTTKPKPFVRVLED